MPAGRHPPQCLPRLSSSDRRSWLCSPAAEGPFYFIFGGIFKVLKSLDEAPGTVLTKSKAAPYYRRMRLFLDSADPQEIQRFARWGVLDGITTTPTFFRRLGVADGRSALQRIADDFPGEIHVEAMGRGIAEILAAAHRNREIGDRVVSKIPITPVGLEACSRLAAEGIAVNLHLVFTVNQALLAAKAGAAYVCPLLGRLNDAGLDAEAVAMEISQALSHTPSTQLMLSSIRTPQMAQRAILCGPHALTVPGSVLGQMIASPLTDKAFNILAKDWVDTSLVAESMRPAEQLPRLAPTDSLDRALEEMTQKGIGIAAIVDDHNAVLGVVTDGDLRRALTNSNASRQTSAESIMSREPCAVQPDQHLQSAVELLRTRRIGQVLVLGPKRELLGFLDLHDLMLVSG